MATTLKPKPKARKQAERPVEKTPSVSKSGKSDEQPIWEIVAELGSQISDEDWKKVPEDSSLNYKTYLYGAPAKPA